ncbi:phage holin family protein [Kribbia dieselivorans]|uniref:phage holin family protein n=1 Tax=Kribbia dieselivorans TaxID=331526 RepID=UPI000838D5D0|nr:phage holin family protein [Kribbia dieselivorans]
MTTFIFRVIVNAVALWVAALLVKGIHLGAGTTESTVWTALIVALVFGVVNALIKPIVSFFAFPLVVLTIGLFTFIVNAFMLQITEWIADPLGLNFTIDHFWWDAVWGAVIITLVSWALSMFVPDGD